MNDVSLNIIRSFPLASHGKSCHSVRPKEALTGKAKSQTGELK